MRIISRNRAAESRRPPTQARQASAPGLPLRRVEVRAEDDVPERAGDAEIAGRLGEMMPRMPVLQPVEEGAGLESPMMRDVMHAHIAEVAEHHAGGKGAGGPGSQPPPDRNERSD